jgi:hypothetical protein
MCLYSLYLPSNLFKLMHDSFDYFVKKRKKKKVMILDHPNTSLLQNDKIIRYSEHFLNTSKDERTTPLLLTNSKQLVSDSLALMQSSRPWLLIGQRLLYGPSFDSYPLNVNKIYED